MKTERRRNAILLVLLVVFILFASFCFLLHETHHECDDEFCPICVMIAICRNSYAGFTLAFVLLAALFAQIYAFLFSRSIETERTHTPVSRKDRLLN